MNGRQFSFKASGNPLVQVLSVLVVGVALIGAVIMGAVILAVVLGLAAIAAAVFSVRVWWLRRKLRASGGGDGGPHADAPSDPRLIEGEYTVLEERDVRARRDRSE
jgi:hypothetical protein